MFYFNWINEGDDFDPAFLNQQTIKIFKLIISEAETLYPTATITVEATPSLWGELTKNTWATISYDNGHVRKQLFKGYVSRFPIKFNGAFAQVELVAKPSNVLSQLQALKDKLLCNHEYDLMLYPHLVNLDQADITDLLAQSNQLVDWDRSRNQAKLIDYQPDQFPHEFMNKHYVNSLDICLKRRALHSVMVKVNIYWTQLFRGETSLDPLLQHLLPDGIISTLTPHDLQERWWKNFERIGHSGYQIKYTKLDAVSPTFIRAQSRTRSILVSNKDPLLIRKDFKVAKRVRLKKFYFKPKISLNWTYCQPRSEQLTMHVCQDLNGMDVKQAHTKQLVINLPEPFGNRNQVEWAPNQFFNRGDYCSFHQTLYLCLKGHWSTDKFQDDQRFWLKVKHLDAALINKHIGVFFSSDRGQHIIDQLKTRATVVLMASRRCVEVKFTCHFDHATGLSTRDTIKLYDDQLPHGFIIGKVKNLILHADGETGQFLAHITLGCSLESVHSPHVSASTNDPVFEQNVMCDASVGQTDIMANESHPLLFPQLFGARDLLKSVKVTSDATQQEKELIDHQFPFGHNLDYTLNQNLTQVHLELEDLKTLPRIHRKIDLLPINMNDNN